MSAVSANDSADAARYASVWPAAAALWRRSTTAYCLEPAGETLDHRREALHALFAARIADGRRRQATQETRAEGVDCGAVTLHGRPVGAHQAGFVDLAVVEGIDQGLGVVQREADRHSVLVELLQPRRELRRRLKTSRIGLRRGRSGQAHDRQERKYRSHRHISPGRSAPRDSLPAAPLRRVNPESRQTWPVHSAAGRYSLPASS